MLISKRNWDVLLIGGASGSGKTSISLPLARHYGVDLVRTDDFQVLLEAITTPATHPAIHYWKTHPNWREEGINAAIEQLIKTGQMLTPGLVAVINDHLTENIPMILEGDFILPELVAAFKECSEPETNPPKNQRVKSIFILEPSKGQILQNFLNREGKIQHFRADVCHNYGNWLAKECSKHGIPIIESQPWDNLMERILNVME